MWTIRKQKKFQRQKYDFRRKKSKMAANYRKIIVVFVLAVFFNVFFFSDIFRIENIQISGNQGAEKNDIKNIISSDLSGYYAGIIAEDNIFLVNKKEIKEKLFVEFSEIEELKIKKVFPKTLKIEIVEKIPFVFWCRLDECYYLDNDGIAFATEETGYKNLNNKKFIKIIEELEIKEEALGRSRTIGEEYYENESKKNEIENLHREDQKIEHEEKMILEKININDQVSDQDFVNFVLEVDSEMRQINSLKIKYYKTKGTKTRQLIAYTDKNVRIYFNAISSAKLQVEYLKEFLSKAISKNEINTMKYIYLESGNKIFYK